MDQRTLIHQYFDEVRVWKIIPEFDQCVDEYIRETHNLELLLKADAHGIRLRPETILRFDLETIKLLNTHHLRVFDYILYGQPDQLEWFLSLNPTSLGLDHYNYSLRSGNLEMESYLWETHIADRCTRIYDYGYYCIGLEAIRSLNPQMLDRVLWRFPPLAEIIKKQWTSLLRHAVTIGNLGILQILGIYIPRNSVEGPTYLIYSAKAENLEAFDWCLGHGFSPRPIVRTREFGNLSPEFAQHLKNKGFKPSGRLSVFGIVEKSNLELAIWTYNNFPKLRHHFKSKSIIELARKLSLPLVNYLESLE